MCNTSDIEHRFNRGFYGNGIYLSPKPQFSTTYAEDLQLFMCLCLPGKRYAATYDSDFGKPRRKGFDSNHNGEFSKKRKGSFTDEYLFACSMNIFQTRQ